MLSLNCLVRLVGGAFKRWGMKMLGEDPASVAQFGVPPVTQVGTTNNGHLTIAFWNVHANSGINADIANLARTLQNENGQRNNVLLGLSEIGKLNLAKILADIRLLTGDSSWGVYQSPSKHLVCFSNTSLIDTKLEVALGWPVIINLDDPNANNPKRCAVWFVHMRAPIMTFAPKNVSASDAQILHKDIIDLEGTAQLDGSVAIGDFNTDPYSDAMLGPDHLNAVMCKKIASKGVRTFNKNTPYARVRPYFYNPMWNSLGDQLTNNQPGSFYSGSDPGNSNAWHLIDQVLVRPTFMDRIVSGSARVLIHSGKRSLLKPPMGTIDKSISDHLPVVISLNK